MTGQADEAETVTLIIRYEKPQQGERLLKIAEEEEKKDKGEKKKRRSGIVSGRLRLPAIDLRMGFWVLACRERWSFQRV